MVKRLVLALLLLCLTTFASARPPDEDNSLTRLGKSRPPFVPTCGTITVIPVGTASDYQLVGVASLQIAGVTALSTDAIILCLGFNTPLAEDVQPVSIFNGATFDPCGVGVFSPDGSYSGEIYYLTNFTGATGPIDIQLDGVDAPKAAAASAYIVRGLQDSAPGVLDPGIYGIGAGSSTTPSVTANNATAQACEALVAMVVTKGPSTDAAGTWGNSFTAVQRVGTTGGATPDLNITVSDATRATTSIGTYTASKSAITSRAWFAIIAGFKQ